MNIFETIGSFFDVKNAENASLVNDKYPCLLRKQSNEQTYRDTHYANLKSAYQKSKFELSKVSEMVDIAADDGDFFVGRLKSPLAIDMCGGVVENGGINLDRNSGIVFISGSALKGCARRFAVLSARETADESVRINIVKRAALVFGFSKNDFENSGKNGYGDFCYALDSSEIAQTVYKELTKEVKGDGFAGCIAFLPAYPKGNKPLLDTDIVNCHHTRYYSGKSQKADDNEQPVPIKFITVRSGTFAFCLRRLRSADASCLDSALEWLKGGLSCGIGAKTAAGYGIFGDFEEETLSYKKQMKADSERRERELAEAAEKLAVSERKRLKVEAEKNMSPEELAATKKANTIGDGDFKKFGKLSTAEKRILILAIEKRPEKWQKFGGYLNSMTGDKLRERQNLIKSITDFAKNMNVEI